MFQILIVEDDKELSQLFQNVLEKNAELAAQDHKSMTEIRKNVPKDDRLCGAVGSTIAA